MNLKRKEKNMKFDTYNNNLCNIWRCYHDPKLLIDIPHTDERTTIIDYYTKGQYEGVCINSIQYYINEVVTLLYPYLNNIKSKYIGFEHYRRAFITEDIDFNRLDNIVAFSYIGPWPTLEGIRIGWCITDIMYNDILEFLDAYYPDVFEFQKHIPFFIRCNIFLTNYDYYMEIAKFYFDYIQYISNKYNLGYDAQKWRQHIYDVYIKQNVGVYLDYAKETFNEDIDKNNVQFFRIYGFILEFIGAMYVQSHHTCLWFGRHPKGAIDTPVFVDNSKK